MNSFLNVGLFLVLMTLGMSCNTNKRQNSQKTSMNIANDTCHLTDDLGESMELVNRDAAKFNKDNSQNDNCYLGFIDTLYNRFMTYSDTSYIECIGRIAKVSDGYVAEYLSEIIENMYFKRFKDLVKYLYTHRNDNEKRMERFLIFFLAEQIEKSEKPRETVSSLKDRAYQEQIPSQEKEYYIGLIRVAEKHSK